MVMMVIVLVMRLIRCILGTDRMQALERFMDSSPVGQPAAARSR